MKAGDGVALPAKVSLTTKGDIAISLPTELGDKKFPVTPLELLQAIVSIQNVLGILREMQREFYVSDIFSNPQKSVTSLQEIHSFSQMPEEGEATSPTSSQSQNKPFGQAVAEAHRHLKQIVDRANNESPEPLRDKSVNETVSGELEDLAKRHESQKFWPVKNLQGDG